MAFALLQGLLIFVLYIVYFFYDKRMYLPVLVMVLPPAASAAANLLRTAFKRTRTANWILAGAAIVLQVVVMHNLNDYHRAIRRIPDDRAKLEVLNAMLPGNAVLLSMFNPAVADKFFLHGTDRKIIPVNRIHEYADKIAAPQKVKAFVNNVIIQAERDREAHRLRNELERREKWSSRHNDWER